MKNKRNRSITVNKVCTTPIIEEIGVIPHYTQDIQYSNPSKGPWIYDNKIAIRVTHTDVEICFRFYEDLRGFSMESVLSAISDTLIKRVKEGRTENEPDISVCIR